MTSELDSERGAPPRTGGEPPLARHDALETPPTRLDLALGLLLVLAAAAYFSLSMDRTLDAPDEGYLLSLAQRVADGEVPHRDFMDIYGPGVHWLNGLVIWAFGPEIYPFRVLLVALKALTIGVVFLMTRLFAPLPLALGGALLGIAWWGRPSWILNTPYASIYSVVLCELALLLFLWGLRFRSLRLLVAAGAVAGLVLAFKQTVALTFAYALGLAAWMTARLEANPGSGLRWESFATVGVWAATALLVLAPGAPMMEFRDYALHFLPFHLFVLLVSGRLLLRGGGGAADGLRELGAVVFGWATVVLVLAAISLALGGVGQLAYDMLVLPTRITHYYLPVLVLAPVALMTLLAVYASGVTAALFALAGRWTAVAWTLGGLALCGGVAALVDPRVLGWPASPKLLWANEAALPCLVALGALGWMARKLWHGGGADETGLLRYAVPLFLVQSMMMFQIFPRAGQNLFVLQIGLVPLLVFVLDRWSRLGLGGGAGRLRRLAASLLALAIPAFWALPSLDWLRHDEPRTTVELPGLRGLRLDAATEGRSRTRAMHRLVAHVDTLRNPETPLLLLSDVQLITFSSRRPQLYPEKQAEFFWTALGMWPAEELGGSVDEAIVARMTANPDALVIRDRRPNGQRLAAALPRVSQLVAQQYEETGEFGPFSVHAQRPADDED